MLKNLTKRTTDDPQYLKGFGEPMPFVSHNEYWQAKKTAEQINARWEFYMLSESDAAELEHLEKRILNHEKRNR